MINALRDVSNVFGTYFDNDLGNGWTYTYSVELEQPCSYNNEDYNLEGFNEKLYKEYEMKADEAKWTRTSIVVSSKDLKKSETFTLSFPVFKYDDQGHKRYYIWRQNSDSVTVIEAYDDSGNLEPELYCSYNYNELVVHVTSVADENYCYHKIQDIESQQHFWIAKTSGVTSLITI